jgi:plasmid stabilization system protein ParE
VNEIRVSPEAEADMDGIWLYVARESHSIEIANRVVDGITARFGLLSRYPAAGRSRGDLTFGVRSFVADGYLILYEYREPDLVVILHVAARGRDLFALYLQ